MSEQPPGTEPAEGEQGWHLRVGLEERAHDPIQTATVGLDKWPWLRAVIASAFVVVWMACCIWDWFVRTTPVLPGWFQMLGVVVLAYLLGVDLVTNFFRGRRMEPRFETRLDPRLR